MDLLDVGTGRFTWRRLHAYLHGLAYVRESAFWRAVDADGEGLWQPDTYLLANAVDALNVANWQRSEDGSKNRNRPKPLPRPSDRRASEDKADLIKQSIAERKRLRAQQQRG